MVSKSDYNVFETQLRTEGFRMIAGVDEVGRGPMAGPIVTAAVILDSNYEYPEVRDSKQISALQRERVFEIIVDRALGISIAASSVRLIDHRGVLNATLNAMKQAIEKLPLEPDIVLIDGNKIPDGMRFKVRSIIGGDGCCRSIAAASIVAKVTRDRLMSNLGKIYPQFGFGIHKGYCTSRHVSEIQQHGLTPHHRMCFNLVRQTSLNFTHQNHNT